MFANKTFRNPENGHEITISVLWASILGGIFSIFYYVIAHRAWGAGVLSLILWTPVFFLGFSFGLAWVAEFVLGWLLVPLIHRSYLTRGWLDADLADARMARAGVESAVKSGGVREL